MVWGALGWPAEEDKKEEDVDSVPDYPEVDYDTNLTPLYEAIEERAWIAVNQFLHSGYWPESLFADPISPEDQARTWVTRYETKPDGSKRVRWSQLPIHAAVIFGAPSVVIQQLVECFPQSVRCTDDHRMLPLHLAFRHGSDDSVLALFLEEFPEAVNVRGYKGRLPVDCASKGPNPERGAIIQTILHKNQSAWERKKSAVQLKELYCVKEALKIKSQKVSHLETAIREIKSREHKTRKELGLTMTELRAAKVKTKDLENTGGTNEDYTADKVAVKMLVEKLAALEMATKDLVEKEKNTRKDLKKTIAELDATKRFKPSESQTRQFEQLEKVASKEGGELLKRGEEENDAASKHTGASQVPASVKTDGTSKKKKKNKKKKASKEKEVEEPEPAVVDEPSIHSEKQPTVQSEKQPSVHSEKQPSVQSKQPTVQSEKQPSVHSEKQPSVHSEKQPSVHSEKQPSVHSEKQPSVQSKQPTVQSKQPTVHSEKQPSVQSKQQSLNSYFKKTSETQSSVKSAEHPPLVQSQSRELERMRLQMVEETNMALEKKIATLEMAMQGYEDKASQTKEELDAVSVPDENNELSDKQIEQMNALREEMETLKENSNKTKEELGLALNQLTALKSNHEDSANAALQESERMHKQTMETNKILERKVALLESALQQFEDKSNMAKEEMQNIKACMSADSAVVLTVEQEKHMQVLEGAMKKLEQNAIKTKGELDNALMQLDKLKAQKEINELQFQQTRQMQNEQYVKEAKEAMARAEKDAQDARAQAAKDAMDAKNALEQKEAEQRKFLLEQEKLVTERAKLELEQKKLQTVEEANVELEAKIASLESTMKNFEDKADKTKAEMLMAMKELQSSDALSVVSGLSGESVKLTKKQKKHMQALTNAMEKLEERASNTKKQLDEALGELESIKNSNETEVSALSMSKKESKAMKDLAKKVQALQLAMVGFEVKETKTMEEMEKTMRDLEEISNKRFEVLSRTTQHSESLATDNQFSKEVEKLEKKATKEEKRINELETSVQEILTQSTSAKAELERTKQILDAIQNKHEVTVSKDGTLTKAEKDEVKQDKKIIKELTKKVSTLQSAVIGFEVKETRTMKELEHTMKQLEELTSKRFEVLEKAAAIKERETERLAEAGALAEEKVAALHAAMKELESNAARTHEELEKTKMELDAMKAANAEEGGTSKKIISTQDKQIKELNAKIGVLQQAVTGFEVKETKTMQELEQTMKQLEELTAKRFEVLQKVAGREIEAAKAAEASKYSEKAAQEEKKVAALENAMRELENKAYSTKLELERTMRSLELLEEKQSAQQHDVLGVTKDEKRVMRELVSKVADIQEAVMAYDDKDMKTVEELQNTKQELEAMKQEVEQLRERQTTAALERAEAEAEIKIMETGTDDAESQVEVVDRQESVADADAQSQSKEANDTARRVTEETLTSLESAIHRLVERLGTSSSDDANDTALKEIVEVAGSLSKEDRPASEETAENASAASKTSSSSKGDKEESSSALSRALNKAFGGKDKSSVASKESKSVASKEAKSVASKESKSVASKAEKSVASKEEVAEQPAASVDQDDAIEELAVEQTLTKEEPSVATSTSKVSNEDAASIVDSVKEPSVHEPIQQVPEAPAAMSAEDEAASQPVAPQSRGVTEVITKVSPLPVAPPVPAPAPAEPKKKRVVSLFGRLSKKGKKVSTNPNPKKVKKTKKHAESGEKSAGCTKAKKSSFKLFGKKAAPAASAPVATSEQRRMVEETHGADIVALLTDQQILTILSTKLAAAPANVESQAIEPAMSTLSKAEEQSIAAGSMNSNKQRSLASSSHAPSAGLVEEDPQCMIVSLPSHRSQKSNTSKKSSVAPIDTTRSGPSSPKGSPMALAGQNDILVTAGTYDDGFEINF